jgi:hypothetical protein
MTTLPPVATPIMAEILGQLPQRLRKRIDSSLDKAAGWLISAEDALCTVEIDADTSLVFRLTSGVLAAADDLTCSCLLAPKCLHRAVAVTVAPVAADTPVVPEEVVSEVSSVTLSVDGRAAAELLWQAGSAVLRAGVSGSGAVVQAELLRAVHTARLAGLHRGAAAALRVVAGVRDAHSRSSSFDRTQLTAELFELLLVCHQLRAGLGDIAALLGTARREYSAIGSLRVYGLFTERVVSGSGYSGVVTHLADDEGRLWTVNAVAPGGPDRVSGAYQGPVAVGESGLSHHALGRSGLLLSAATASADHRLGAGSSVRAVAAQGSAWTAPPLARLWEEPVDAQIRRAFDGAQDLLFLSGVIVGSTGSALQVELDDRRVDLIGSSDAAWENLRLLAGMPGRAIQVIARLVPDRPATAVALAASGDLTVPESWGNRVNLTLERLQRSYVDTPAEMAPQPAAAPDPSPVELLDRWLHRVTLGGRKMPMISSASADRARLTRIGLTGTAQVLGALEASARDESRDAFGRLISRDDDSFALAWLRGCVHSREFSRSTAMTAWSDS